MKQLAWLWSVVPALIAVAAGAFATPPAQSFRFVILGDRTGAAQPGVYEQVWREVDAWRPDMVINAGDTIEGGDDSTAAREWTALEPLWTKYRRYPLYFTPGNHDIWSEASREIYEHRTGHPAHYGFDFGNAHFTVLDNSRTEALDDGEMQFLAADLERSPSRALKFVFFHRPFWLVPVLLGGDFPLQTLVRRYHVQYVVSGHAHRFARFVVPPPSGGPGAATPAEGVTYLMVGSSGAHRRGSSFEDGWFFHHIRVTVEGGKVRMVVKEVDPPFGGGRSFDVERWGSGPVMQDRAFEKQRRP